MAANPNPKRLMVEVVLPAVGRAGATAAELLAELTDALEANQAGGF
jgi:hypothetical protein